MRPFQDCSTSLSRAAYARCVSPHMRARHISSRTLERRDLADRAIRLLDGRLPVIAQVNHVSADYVAETARSLVSSGAAAISVAVPRMFALPERDLLRYFDRILRAITVPLVIQDFNPGGGSVSLEFIKSLHAQHSHFRYLKLEEPLMCSKVQAIREGTEGGVGVIDGWGGTYMLELIEAGICGVMPGLGVSDLLQIIWAHARAGTRIRLTTCSRAFCRKSVTACKVSNSFSMRRRLCWFPAEFFPSRSCAKQHSLSMK